jgi:hypothetical protein
VSQSTQRLLSSSKSFLHCLQSHHVTFSGSPRDHVIIGYATVYSEVRILSRGYSNYGDLLYLNGSLISAGRSPVWTPEWGMNLIKYWTLPKGNKGIYKQIHDRTGRTVKSGEVTFLIDYLPFSMVDTVTSNYLSRKLHLSSMLKTPDVRWIISIPWYG